MQELNVAVDEAFVTHVLQAAYDLLEYLDRSLNQQVVHRVPDYTRQQLVTSDMIYARLLFFGPVRVTLSYSSCPWGAASLKGDVVEKILTFLGPVSGLERAALQLNSLRLDNAFATRGDLVKTISVHYRQAAASKLLLLLGSAHFIGSPITLVESIGTGFWDLWYEPVLGLTHSPKAFAEGVSRGTRSMLSKTVYGVAKSASDLTGSIGSVTAQLSFDPEYIQGRERDRKQQAQHVGEGLAFGAWDFGKGLFDGVTGLVTRPIAGAQQEGAAGFFKGIGRGLTGVVVKPIAGTLGMASRITEGVKNTANRAARVDRVRLPRFIGASGVIQSYNGTQAEGQALLYSLKGGAFQTEFYVFHYPPMDATVYAKTAQKETTPPAALPLRTARMLVSNRHVICVKGSTVTGAEVVWCAPLVSSHLCVLRRRPPFSHADCSFASWLCGVPRRAGSWPTSKATRCCRSKLDRFTRTNCRICALWCSAWRARRRAAPTMSRKPTMVARHQQRASLRTRMASCRLPMTLKRHDCYMDDGRPDYSNKKIINHKNQAGGGGSTRAFCLCGVACYATEHDPSVGVCTAKGADLNAFRSRAADGSHS